MSTSNSADPILARCYCRFNARGCSSAGSEPAVLRLLHPGRIISRAMSRAIDQRTMIRSARRGSGCRSAYFRGKVETQIRTDLREFVTSAFLFGDSARMPGDEASLLEAGVLDSTGVLELIEFLEEKFGISVEDSETLPENLGSIDGLTRFVVLKRSGQDARSDPSRS